MQFLVERITGANTKQVWSFDVVVGHSNSKIGVVLSCWWSNERVSEDHAWMACAVYDRHRAAYRRGLIDESAVEIPDDVAREALGKVISGVKVGKWKADFGEML